MAGVLVKDVLDVLERAPVVLKAGQLSRVLHLGRGRRCRAKPSFKEDRPRTDVSNSDHAIDDPRIGRKPSADRCFAFAIHYKDDLSLVEWSPENDEIVLDKLIQEASMLVKQLLFA